MRALGLGLAMAAAMVTWSTYAQAGACCGEVSTFGDRLTTGEIHAASVGFLVRPRFGSFGGQADFHSILSGSSDVGLGLVGDTLARVTDAFEVGASVEGMLHIRSSGDIDAVGGGVGDVRARGRATLVSSADTRYWPGVSTLVGVVIPTGVPASRSDADLGVDVTGQGAGEVVIALSVDKLWEEVVFARVDGAVGFFMPETIATRAVVRAPRLTVSMVVGPNFDWGSLGVGITHEAEAPPLTSPARDAQPTRHRTELALLSAFPINRTFSLLAQIRSPLPVNGFGSQEVAALTTTVAARVAVLQ